ncbi:hypothetical protein OHA72_44120 [Dactylosporangium sp. NBC_01737]|uniref:hypothetical protein n=1 Tax=Dactylosporangium sp. NBC_01737 TaxID=2975959 RepID=UPI002E158C1D|nr:hypothetical protein OHA72_44120 [Dactylosporangium sp. NBC_01737]
MQVLLKIVITAVAGGLTYLLTNTTDQPDIWQLTMSIFVGGVVFVVQFLIDAAEQSRRTAELVARIHEGATLLAESEGVLGSDSLTRLVKAAGGLDRREGLQLRFAEQQVEDLATLFNGLKAGRASHEGEHPDWLLGLTDRVSVSIDATSLTSFSEYQGYVDEGAFWESELGLRYLARQRRAIERNVRIRRLFVLTDNDVDDARVAGLLEPHRKIGVETRVLPLPQVDPLVAVADFIIFDQKICYEFQTSRAARENTRFMLETVALMVGDQHLQLRRRDFEALWAGAES